MSSLRIDDLLNEWLNPTVEAEALTHGVSLKVADEVSTNTDPTRLHRGWSFLNLPSFKLLWPLSTRQDNPLPGAYLEYHRAATFINLNGRVTRQTDLQGLQSGLHGR